MDEIVSFILSSTPGALVLIAGLFTLFSGLSGHVVWGKIPLPKSAIKWVIGLGIFIIAFGFLWLLAAAWTEFPIFWDGLFAFIGQVSRNLFSPNSIAYFILALFVLAVFFYARETSISVSGDCIISSDATFAGVTVENTGGIGFKCVAKLLGVARVDEIEGEDVITPLDLNKINPRRLLLRWENGEGITVLLPQYPRTIYGVFQDRFGKVRIAYYKEESRRLFDGVYIIQIGIFHRRRYWRDRLLISVKGVLSVQSTKPQNRPMIVHFSWLEE